MFKMAVNGVLRFNYTKNPNQMNFRLIVETKNTYTLAEKKNGATRVNQKISRQSAVQPREIT